MCQFINKEYYKKRAAPSAMLSSWTREIIAGSTAARAEEALLENEKAKTPSATSIREETEALTIAWGNLSHWQFSAEVHTDECSSNRRLDEAFSLDKLILQWGNAMNGREQVDTGNRWFEYEKWITGSLRQLSGVTKFILKPTGNLEIQPFGIKAIKYPTIHAGIAMQTWLKHKNPTSSAIITYTNKKINPISTKVYEFKVSFSFHK